MCISKYCKFSQDVKDKDGTIWEKDKEYEVVYEDEKYYYFGKLKIKNGIAKTYEGHMFDVIEKEDDTYKNN